MQYQWIRFKIDREVKERTREEEITVTLFKIEKK